MFWLAIPFLRREELGALLGSTALLGLGAALRGATRARGYSSLPVTLVMTTLVVFAVHADLGAVHPDADRDLRVSHAARRDPPASTKRLWLVVGWSIVAVMLPFVLEWTGVLDPPMR